MSSSDDTATLGIVGWGILIVERTDFFVTIGDESLSFCDESEAEVDLDIPCTLILDRGVLKIYNCPCNFSYEKLPLLRSSTACALFDRETKCILIPYY